MRPPKAWCALGRHYFGNQILTLMSDALTNVNLTDMETGYKVFRQEVIQGVRLRCNRFGFEPEFPPASAAP